MPLYEYRAKDADGRTLQGCLEIDSEKDLVNKLRQDGLIVISVEKKKVRGPLFRGRKGGGKVKGEDLVIFSRQLATMVEAGLPLIQSLNVLGEQIEKGGLGNIVKEVEKDVEGGGNLSEALAKHPRAFSGLFVNLVKAGEAGGMLDEILDRISSYLEASISLKRKVKSALVYPAVIVSVAFLIVLFMMIVVVPSFESIFADFGGQLPAPTQILINVSKWMKQYFLYGLGAFGVGIYILRRYIKTDKGRVRFDRLTLKLPIFGSLLQKVAISKFSRTLSTLLKSGVPILSSLEIVAVTSGNKVVEEAIDKVRSSIREGESITAPLKESGIFPAMVVRMIGVGEQTGKLEEMLSKISDFYDDQVNTAVSGLTSMIEPFIIVFLGVVIGSIVLAIFLPIFKMGELVQM
ncbi:MAG: type II secretion system F family protein [Nitrospirae bacterium]|nr:type II secretion system F family protein [Nitrospirota bacterium]